MHLHKHFNTSINFNGKGLTPIQMKLKCFALAAAYYYVVSSSWLNQPKKWVQCKIKYSQLYILSIYDLCMKSQVQLGTLYKHVLLARQLLDM